MYRNRDNFIIFINLINKIIKTSHHRNKGVLYNHSDAQFLFISLVKPITADNKGMSKYEREINTGDIEHRRILETLSLILILVRYSQSKDFILLISEK